MKVFGTPAIISQGNEYSSWDICDNFQVIGEMTRSIVPFWLPSGEKNAIRLEKVPKIFTGSRGFEL